METEARILETIAKIRSRDSSIYDPETRFFRSDEDEEAAGAFGSPTQQACSEARPRPLWR